MRPPRIGPVSDTTELIRYISPSAEACSGLILTPSDTFFGILYRRPRQIVTQNAGQFTQWQITTGGTLIYDVGGYRLPVANAFTVPVGSGLAGYYYLECISIVHSITDMTWTEYVLKNGVGLWQSTRFYPAGIPALIDSFFHSYAMVYLAEGDSITFWFSIFSQTLAGPGLGDENYYMMTYLGS
jgi:hypothetical protein